MYHNGWVPEISEKEKLENILKSCKEQLKRDPGNEWWENYRKLAQDKLDKIHEDEHADDIAAFRSCEKFNTGL